MQFKMEKKTITIICGILLFFLLALFYGFHILKPALDPVLWSMTKIFLCGTGCGLLPGIWIGIKIARAAQKKELERAQAGQ